MTATLWRARENSGADIAVGGVRFFRGDGLPGPRRGDVVRIPLCDPHELGLISNQYGGPVALWPRTLLATLGGFRSSPVEDWLLLARASVHGARMTGNVFHRQRLSVCSGMRQYPMRLMRRNPPSRWRRISIAG